MHRARAYKGSKLGPEKQARQNPKVGFGLGPVVRLYRNRSKRNIRGKCSICSDKKKRLLVSEHILHLPLILYLLLFVYSLITGLILNLTFGF